MNETIPFVLTRPRRYEEASIQKAVVNFLRWALPENAICFSLPLDGFRHKGEAARMVGLGLKAGLPDLEIVYDGTPIFIEIKTEIGRLSAVQRQMHAKLSDCGADVFVCRSLDHVQAVLLEVGVRLRGKLG